VARARDYGEWSHRNVVPAEVPPEMARDIILDWFTSVHGPHFAATKAAIGVPADEATVRMSVKGSLRLAFKRHGDDYERPTREALLKVCRYLHQKSLSWGTPQDVASRHLREIERIIDRVPAHDN